MLLLCTHFEIVNGLFSLLDNLHNLKLNNHTSNLHVI